MTNKRGRYKINEKDIDRVLNFLRIYDPEHAVPEIAIDLIEFMQTNAHIGMHEDPKTIEELYEAFKREKLLKTN